MVSINLEICNSYDINIIKDKYSVLVYFNSLYNCLFLYKTITVILILSYTFLFKDHFLLNFSNQNITYYRLSMQSFIVIHSPADFVS